MIGERLEEARKRKNVSIRESAEATKIRGDYLIAMEDNSFDIPLPQIYIRGFLKNYARFLKLDPNKVLTDYDAFLLGRSSPVASSTVSSHAAPSSDRESLGHIEIPDEEPASTASPRSQEDNVVVTEAPEEDDGPDPELRFSIERETAEHPRAEAPAQPHPAPPPPTLEREGMRHDPESWNENKTLYMKIGIVFAGILLVSIILIVLIQLIRGGGDTPAINPELATQTAEAEPEPPAPVVATTDGPIVITASDNVTLIVEQTIDRKRLYSGSLNAGESLSLDKEGPVSIRFTNGSALVIEQGGRQVRPSQAGVGRTVVE